MVCEQSQKRETQRQKLKKEFKSHKSRCQQNEQVTNFVQQMNSLETICADSIESLQCVNKDITEDYWRTILSKSKYDFQAVNAMIKLLQTETVLTAPPSELQTMITDCTDTDAMDSKEEEKSDEPMVASHSNVSSWKINNFQVCFAAFSSPKIFYRFVSVKYFLSLFF